MGIGIAVIAITIFSLALTNPNLRENKDTYFGIIDTKPEAQPHELIETFKEKYSDYEIIEYPDSKGITWKYSVNTVSSDVELIFGSERTILRSYGTTDGDLICTVINPFPKDIMDSCPPKW